MGCAVTTVRARIKRLRRFIGLWRMLGLCPFESLGFLPICRRPPQSWNESSGSSSIGRVLLCERTPLKLSLLVSRSRIEIDRHADNNNERRDSRKHDCCREIREKVTRVERVSSVCERSRCPQKFRNVIAEDVREDFSLHGLPR